MVLLARKDEEGNTQALYDHLHGAGRLASGFEDEFADISRTAAVLHDVGKVAQQFQTYLLSDDGHRGDVQHARQGAFVVNDFFESKGEIEEIAKEILELAISKHHGGLPDCIDESGNRAFLLGFTESDKSNEKYAYQEIKRGLNGLALDLQSNFRGSAEDIACFLKKIKSLRLSKDSIYFYLGLLVKLIYSRLVDADRTDAACFETRKQYRPNAVDWQNLISRLDKSMRSFDSSSEINRIRHQINEQCCLAGARETGIYRLSIPTGGGKTLASLNFALHHALKTGKRRIIYVIPYLSITTQTAKTFRDVLGLNSDSDVLLEHYSTAGMQRSADVADNASSEFEDAGEHQRKLAAERWDNPIIVTTMVEFLETVMSARGTKLRKFHNMADSVIIFDEIQSLPMNTINLFNEIVSFLSKITNSTILLCSATQPLLEKTKRENLLLSEKPDLIAETESYEDKLRRTRIVASAENKSCDELGQIIYQQARKNGNCLAIVNLKKEAREIFQCLERLDVNHEFELIHLSTAMCGRHRTDCLNRIGALLDPGNPKPVICVSTQLIEAGVDISFACVVRAMAGLDSIMQAAGRCNRNGESVEPKNVYVYPLKDEDSMERYLPDIAMGKQLTLQIMENYPGKDLLSSNIVVFGKVCERWLDVRSFGQVFAFKKAKDTDEVSIGVRGPVSIQPAFSINPIAIDDVQITKSVNSETTDSGKKSSDTMGMKYRVSGRAVYVTYGSISPQLAERTGFSAEDAEKIKEALVTLFENDESSARPSGSMEVLDVVWFAHNCKGGGQYSSAKVHRSVSVDADGTVNVDDASIPGLRYEVIEGR